MPLANIISRSALKRWPRLAGPVLVSVLFSFVLLSLGLYRFDQAGALTRSPWLVGHLFQGQAAFPWKLADAVAQGVFFTFTNINEGNIANPVLDRPASYDVVGFKNYLDVLSGGESFGAFWDTLVRTLIWTFSCVFFHYTIGLGLALLLNRQMRGRTIYRVLLILPWAVPAFISAFAWKYMFNAQYGIINQLLRAVGLPPEVQDSLTTIISQFRQQMNLPDGPPDTGPRNGAPDGRR